MGRRKPVAPLWADRDTALWHRCEIAVDLAAGTVPLPRQQVASMFPPQLGYDEQFWAVGPFALLEQRALGDGSYQHNGGFFYATGRGGLTATATVAAFRAAGNSSRRRAAEAAAVPRWVQVDQDALYVSRYGIHLQTAHALLPWSWTSFTAAQMVGPGAVHLLGEGANRSVSWVLHSDWAELVFVAWALARHRKHPQLLNGAWLPPGWLQRCAEQAHSTRLTTPALTT